MTRRQARKAPRLPPLLVGVVASAGDLRIASHLHRRPDVFEIRLDHLYRHLDEVDHHLPNLANFTPIIITARHPVEGGANALSTQQRRDLLVRFLPSAAYVDIELCSARSFESILARAREQKSRCILSFHDFRSTPSVRSLTSKARTAKKNGADIFKVATRTDSVAELSRLIDFFKDYDSDVAISAMGIGKLGCESRRKLMQLGSVLNYASLRRQRVPGQPLLSELRRWTCSS